MHTLEDHATQWAIPVNKCTPLLMTLFIKKPRWTQILIIPSLKTDILLDSHTSHHMHVHPSGLQYVSVHYTQDMICSSRRTCFIPLTHSPPQEKIYSTQHPLPPPPPPPPGHYLHHSPPPPPMHVLKLPPRHDLCRPPPPPPPPPPDIFYSYMGYNSPQGMINTIHSHLPPGQDL